MIKSRKPPEPKEADEQRHLFLWAQMMSREHPELELLNSSMNGAWIPGGKSRAEQGRKFGIIKALKKLGCIRSGFPDISLPVPRGDYHGLFIELKRRKGGKVSPDQQWWLDRLRGQGYCAVVARGADEAKDVIINYLFSEIISSNGTV